LQHGTEEKSNNKELKEKVDELENLINSEGEGSSQGNIIQ